MCLWGFERKWDEDVMWGHEKAKSTLNKDEVRSSKNSSRYIVSHEVYMCGEGADGSFCFWNVCPRHSYAKLWENEIYGDGYREAFSPEASHRRESLTGWGVDINHATAVSSAGASSGLKRAVVRSRLLLPAPAAPLKNVPPQQVDVRQRVRPAWSCWGTVTGLQNLGAGLATRYLNQC